ncbi:kinetochore protein SPC25 homolog [Triticum urartu]|uniref:kinetochore protein SPC25 homolog n=1 Tax=Triticum urartu TaxID=4572 RepID=UPI002044891B|nr:kinetochore protein SPC25 homolog [Triticum urartu]
MARKNDCEKKINGLQDQLMGLEASLAEALSTIEAIEANIDMMGKKNLDEAIMWYNKFLGFEVFAGEGVRFVFNKVGMQRRRACSLLVLHFIEVLIFFVTVIQCIPLLEDTEELLKDRTNDLFKFVRNTRARFQLLPLKK